jgi:rhodanese-related sulfurtransferase
MQIHGFVDESPGHSSYAIDPLTTVCGRGGRAMTAATVLTRRGSRGIVVLEGGPDTLSAPPGRPLAVGP